ncbi:MAG: polysaccharide pyruvyl transferase family protein [Chloroflexi bacterium]|nr:MAG: polysaccharide pyruvyl transferase family protein [Chloroflexota bacterium]
MSGQTIVLAGAYGRGNVADDLLARVTASALRRDGRRVVVAADGRGTGDPEEARSGASLWRRLDRDTQLMLAGGEPLNDSWTLDRARQLASMCVLARARGASVSAAGVSLEPPSTWRGAQMARAVGAAARVLGVRDSASLEVAQRLGARRTLLGVDLGWLAVEELADLLPEAPPPGSRDLLMVTIEGKTEAIARRRIALLAGVLRALRARYPGVEVRLVAMQRHLPAPHDDRALPWRSAAGPTACSSPRSAGRGSLPSATWGGWARCSPTSPARPCSASPARSTRSPPPPSRRSPRGITSPRRGARRCAPGATRRATTSAPWR